MQAAETAALHKQSMSEGGQGRVGLPLNFIIGNVGP